MLSQQCPRRLVTPWLALAFFLPTARAQSATPQEVTPSENASQPAEPDDGPWRLTSALGLPEWLRISGSFRLRVEGIDHGASFEGQYFEGMTVRVELADPGADGHAGWLVNGEQRPAGPLELVLREDTVLVAQKD